MDGSLGDERNESVKSKGRVHVSEWNAINKCKMQSAKLPQVIEFKYNMYGLATHVGDETKTTQEDRLWRW